MTQVNNIIKDNYNMMLLNDYLKKSVKDAGFSNVDISKTPMGTRITLFVTRPGIVIGRKGVGIRELTEILEKKFGLKNPQISVEEVKKPELSPSVMCNRMAAHIERGTAFRRATFWTLQQIMESGAMGVQITISGKLRGDRSAFEKHTQGILPRAGEHAKNIVDEDIAHVKTPMGLIGIRIRIAQKDKVIPEFKLNKLERKTIEKEQSDEKITIETETEKVETETEKVETETEKVETETEKVETETEKVETETEKVETETEQIEIDSEKIKHIDTMEDEEAELK
jgi:small subunit ribosomal protein S3